MSALDDYFYEMERHMLARAHGTLTLDAKKELYALRSDNLRLQKAVDEARPLIKLVNSAYSIKSMEFIKAQAWLTANPEPKEEK